MERFNDKAKEEDQGALALVLDLPKEFEWVSLPVVWAWATHFSFPRKSCECCAGSLSTRGVYSSKDVREPLTTITAILPGSKWSCLLLRIALQDAFSEIDRIDTTSRTDGNGRTRQNRRNGQNWKNWRQWGLPGNKKNTSHHFQFSVTRTQNLTTDTIFDIS